MEGYEDIKYDLMMKRLKAAEGGCADCERLKDYAEINERAAATVELLVPHDHYCKNKPIQN
jgi:hypothetical protein